MSSFNDSDGSYINSLFFSGIIFNKSSSIWVSLSIILFFFLSFFFSFSFSFTSSFPKILYSSHLLISSSLKVFIGSFSFGNSFLSDLFSSDWMNISLFSITYSFFSFSFPLNVWYKHLFISSLGKALFLDSKWILSIFVGSKTISFLSLSNSFSGAYIFKISPFEIILSTFGLSELYIISSLAYGSNLLISLSISVSDSIIFFFFPLINTFSLLISNGNSFLLFLSLISSLLSSSVISVPASWVFVFLLLITNSSFGICSILLNSFIKSASVSVSLSFNTFLNFL